jgi:DNA-3-methyladenine glycosylase II
MASTTTILRERPAGNLYETSGTLKAREPFDLGQSIGFLNGFRPMAEDQVTGPNVITKALMVDGQTVVFRLESGKGGKGPMDCTLFSKDSISPRLKGSAMERISFFFSLEDDLGPFYEIVERDDPQFMPVVKQMFGFHHVKFPSVLECAVWSILAQRSPLALSRKQKFAIMERFGDSIGLDGKVYRSFPDIGRLAEAGFDEVAKVINNRRKAEYLVSLLNAFPELDMDRLMKMDFEQAKQRLMEIKGIGEWSSHFILSRGMGRMERLPSNLKKEIPRVDEVYGPEMTVERVKSIYGNWAGYWLLYLWAHGIEPGERGPRLSSRREGRP